MGGACVGLAKWRVAGPHAEGRRHCLLALSFYALYVASTLTVQGPLCNDERRA